eukprot:ANDGO_08612.mRNA.1 hypothetical protein
MAWVRMPESTPPPAPDPDSPVFRSHVELSRRVDRELNLDCDPRDFVVLTRQEDMLPGDLWTAGYLMTLPRPARDDPSACEVVEGIGAPAIRVEPRMFVDRRNFEMLCNANPERRDAYEKWRIQKLFVPLPFASIPAEISKAADDPIRKEFLIDLEITKQHRVASRVACEYPDHFAALEDGALLVRKRRRSRIPNSSSSSFDAAFACSVALRRVEQLLMDLDSQPLL